MQKSNLELSASERIEILRMACVATKESVTSMSTCEERRNELRLNYDQMLALVSESRVNAD